jgi:hypothetical protein
VRSLEEICGVMTRFQEIRFPEILTDLRELDEI